MVELQKDSSGLGINLAGNRSLSTMSVFVVGIQPNSVAGQSGLIQIGDELLEVCSTLSVPFPNTLSPIIMITQLTYP